ncbi:YbaK/EbsC family protein [Streptomyces sp. S6]|nr:YbaK/EbsC family protein [Streptomyces sp. S6]
MSTPEPTESTPAAPAPAEASHAHPRFAEALAELGLQVEVRRFPDATRTAAEAAAAIGCELSEIVKSLVFTADGVPVLVLMDGSSRVDVELVRRELGAQQVKRADAAWSGRRPATRSEAYPPFGHATKTRVLADRRLLDHAVVWAAAGTPHTVFPLDPKTLIAHAGATVVDVREPAK